MDKRARITFTFLVEGKARLRAIPVHEFIDGVPVSALGFGAIQAIENGSFRVIEIGQSRDSLRSLRDLFEERFFFMASGPP